ncbi:MAG: N-formylglutamate amidohydrolase [Phenylobacterium sp.]|uniref:N-formylglutamate amidohydrolase n=1 Tax=Phenylobacterium sp. TaxID=1871053 RepID=UPI001B62B5CD|nr:N-formylglutamate amidohydrolase [Phenylobacterium sp.]MBP7817867.1 N-formylglutamate amidohydrolase [Phenylobacterium sp.]MBP9231482.1 N-formylglutamate amidohydrolase [Phenylobacterium sp.]MBP9755262.1 N-formylglutamate amidohydrolase [Phenylobacterium sp.]
MRRDDPSPVHVTNVGGACPLLLIGDHAGRAIPRRLDGLGLTSADMDTHIAWDIGVAGLGERLAARLDACFIRQTYSRLVVDCNRKPGAPAAMPEISDGVTIPGNLGLDTQTQAARRAEIYQPYQDAIGAELDRRAGRPTILVSLHSFTPVMQGVVRPWRMGVLHRGDSAFSSRVLALLQRELGEAAGDNEPYKMDDTDNTVPLHADPRGLDYLELEVRQDLIADAAGQDEVADLVARLLTEALTPG